MTQPAAGRAEPARGRGPFSAGTPSPDRLPPGRHGIPANLVAEHQRLRLIAAMAEALAEHGYASVTTTHVSERAGVSTSTFYKHFGNLWDCLLAAYVAAADRLCEEIEAACAAGDADRERDSRVGIDAALAFFAAEPQLGRLLCAQAPREASALCAARRLLISRLAAMLRRGRGPSRRGAAAARARRAPDRRHPRLRAPPARQRRGRAPPRAGPRAGRDPRPASGYGVDPSLTAPHNCAARSATQAHALRS